MWNINSIFFACSLFVIVYMFKTRRAHTAFDVSILSVCHTYTCVSIVRESNIFVCWSCTSGGNHFKIQSMYTFDNDENVDDSGCGCGNCDDYDDDNGGQYWNTTAVLKCQHISCHIYIGESAVQQVKIMMTKCEWTAWWVSMGMHVILTHWRSRCEDGWK